MGEDKWRRVEREWSREFRRHILGLHGQRGILGNLDDVPTLVLALAVRLLEAEKGLLITSRDGEPPEPEVTAVEGFVADPRGSATVRHFSRETLGRDTIVREEGWSKVIEPATAADREIENLIAIPVYVRDEFDGVVVCANLPGGFHEHDEEVLLALGDHAGAALEAARLHHELREAYMATVRVLAEMIEVRDPGLRRHSTEVADAVAAVADRLNLEPQRREELVFASLLHDVGKIGVSEAILLKPSGLTQEEYGEVKRHPQLGAQLVEQVPALQPIAPAIRHHHERFDGEGYPGELKGTNIPLEARILAVADSFTAMIEDRPYSPPMSEEDACRELERCGGTQFDPEVVRAFVAEIRGGSSIG
ncbi:MAG TPA: HD domain-containing phosphohydrolase [Solirubrobacterales bacterium]|nr:HD domain-containing phosphohydrolase [Solirubrobacterales bacterium]